jgi:Domain of unknown function (DUF222)/HNH endonuclease
MDSLRTVLEEFRERELRFCSDEELETDIGELRRAVGAFEAESARRVAEIERRGTFARQGHPSITSWVDQRFQTGWGNAARQVRLGRALERLPAVREALVEGHISHAAADQLVAAREANPAQFDRVEDVLLDAARRLPIRELRRAVTHWRDAVDAEAAAREAAERFDRRGLHVSPTFEGMVRVDGNLDPETGQTVISAIQAVIDAGAHAGGGDRRTPAQRRADALGEVCRGWLDSSDRPAVGGERPHVTVTVDLETLEGRDGRRRQMGDVGPITAEAARRWACDASLTRVITRGRSEPLDVGRRTPVVPAGIRRALIVRDGGCAFTGCDRPPSWCDAHHVRHWASGGETALGNLVLLCRHHHRAVHHGFAVRIVSGLPAFYAPDGSPLESRSPPRASADARASGP